jgi:hypothetical protein
MEMTRLVRIASLLIAISMLSACATHQTPIAGTIDDANKSITVSASNSGLNGKVKAVLSEQGWQMTVLKRPKSNPGALGSEITIERYENQPTRYSLLLSYRQVDLCLDLQHMVSFDISIIDNERGIEIFGFGGNGCENKVAEQFSKNLQNASYGP